MHSLLHRLRTTTRSTPLSFGRLSTRDHQRLSLSLSRKMSTSGYFFTKDTALESTMIDQPKDQARSLWTLIATPRIEMGLERVEIGACVPKHFHQDNEEIIFIVSGQALVEIGESDQKTVGGGTAIYVPKGIPHSLKNVSQSEPLIFTYTFTPPLALAKRLQQQKSVQWWFKITEIGTCTAYKNENFILDFQKWAIFRRYFQIFQGLEGGISRYLESQED